MLYTWLLFTCSLIAFNGFIKSLATKFPQLTMQLVATADKKWALVQGKIDLDSLSQSPFHNPRMIVTCENDGDFSYSFEANFVSIHHGQLPRDKECFNKLIASLLPGSGYSLCKGLPSELSTAMAFDTKKIRKWGFPFHRLDHQDCPMWFCSISALERCECCSQLMYYVRRQGQKRQSVTPKQKATRVQPSSHFPLKYLSPDSLKLRRDNASKEHKSVQRKVS